VVWLLLGCIERLLLQMRRRHIKEWRS
jgi:hypothetical protein